MLRYTAKVKWLKTPMGSWLWRYWRGWRGSPVGNYNDLPEYIRKYAPGKSFADIGTMWGVNGKFAFLAEEAGAIQIKAVDVFGPTPEFEQEHQKRGSNVEFILGDASHPDTIARIGVVDVVFCAGVLYHHPSPFDLLVALRQICGQRLILRTSSIPEIKGLPNAAIYWPMLRAEDRKLWNLQSLGLPRQVGITDDFEAEKGYSNWFWGMTPSCLQALLATAGFKVEHRATEPFAQTFVCHPIAMPLAHRLPGEREARQLGESISKAGVARPA